MQTFLDANPLGEGQIHGGMNTGHSYNGSDNLHRL
jgi:hypothetical protein